MRSVTDSGEASKRVEDFFAQDLQRKWLNEFIDGLERVTDWPKFVETARANALGRMKGG